MVVKCISLNLWWGGYLMPAVLDFLRSEDADIVALQEVYDGKSPDLDERYRTLDALGQLQYPYYDFAQAFIQDDPVGKIPSGNAILSKLPLISRDVRFLVEPTLPAYKDIPEMWPIEPRVLQYAALDAGNSIINLYNFHGVWDLNGDNPSEARQDMVRTISQEVKGKKNVILTGDTNAKSTNPALQPLETSLKSVFGHDLKTTFNMRRKDNPGYATAAVDLMYVSPEINILTKDCPDVDVSDHLPLVVSFEL